MSPMTPSKVHFGEHVMLEDGLDLERAYQDQDPEFFISKGIKRGIARRFVGDIRSWVENVKKAILIYEIL